MPGSPAAALVLAPRHTQWPRNQTSHEDAACCVGVTLHRMRVKGIRWGRVAVGRVVASGLCAKYGHPLEVPCCRTRRRRRFPCSSLSGTLVSYGASAVARTSGRGHVAET